MKSLLLVALATGTASAAPRPPCDGCVLDVPAKVTESVPLVVVLHGDREHARDAGARWRSTVKARGWALLAIECPKQHGCKDSYWKWNGDAQWIIDQVAATATQVNIDASRVYLVGWSGGATYIGWHVQAWPSTFAALVIHGGGDAPSDKTCVDTRAYFLVGEHNALHHLARQLREYLEGCKQPVKWDAFRGGHAKERTALTRRKANEILDWLAVSPAKTDEALHK